MSALNTSQNNQITIKLPGCNHDIKFINNQQRNDNRGNK